MKKNNKNSDLVCSFCGKNQSEVNKLIASPSVSICNKCVDLCNAFKGPMELLLHLIRKNEVDIHDISVAMITEQYLKYLDFMLDMNPNLAGEFMAMATALINIKSRMMLPLPPDENSEWTQQFKRHAEQLKNAARQLETRNACTQLSQAAMKTLAIVAYRQPIMKAEVEKIRGVKVNGIIRMLMEKKLVRIMGRLGVPGRPLIYGTTKRFLKVFELNKLSALPTLEEVTCESNA